jgi:RimJ/RimL family protein N-acetyltransferase
MGRTRAARLRESPHAIQKPRGIGCDRVFRVAGVTWGIIEPRDDQRLAERAVMRFAIETERLVLRKLGEEDLDALVELDSDPEVMRYINDGVPNPRELYVESLLPRMLAWAQDDPVGFYAAIHAGSWVGWFHLRPSIADERALELGYRLRRSAWGRGLATEGSRALAGLAVDELRPPWIDGCARPDNLASIAVLQKCGLQYVDNRVHPRAPVEVAFYRAGLNQIIRDAAGRP